MQVTETLNSGLKREIKVIVPAKDMESKLSQRLDDAKGKVNLKGFRPGRVPAQHLRRVYGRSFMAEVVNEIISDSASILSDRGEKPAMQPEISMTDDEKEAEKVLAGQADFEFSMSYEVIPPIELKDFSKIKITRQVYDIPDVEVEEQVLRVADSARTYESHKGKASDGDKVRLDYLGKIDGEAFDGGAAEDSEVVIGLNQFITGFEEQLIGLKAGDETTIKVTFPEEYAAQHLAGKEAAFDIKIKDVLKPNDLVINDETAKALNVESADKLRELVRGQLENQFGQVTRQKAKRQILDALDETYQFDAPSKLVESEFDSIWQQVTRDLEEAKRSFADEDTTEEEAREEYRGLAERRVRLGLVLSEIGEKAGVQITDEEVQRALIESIRRYPPHQQQEIYEFYQKNPQAMANIRAPLFEEKVVDHLLGEITVVDQKVSRDELMADDDDGEGNPKPAKKKAASKKAPAKKATPKKSTATKADK